MLQLWKSVVIPRLDYCSQLWNPHHRYLINQLEELQKSFIRNIHGLRHMEYCTALKQLGLYSLQRRRERYQIIYIWSIAENLVPNIKSTDGNLIKIQSSVQSRRGRTLQTKPLKNSHFSTLRFDSLPFHGSRLFNGLPKCIRNTSGCAKVTFKHILDTFLMNTPDQPLIPHHTSIGQVSSNSLVSYYTLADSNVAHYRRVESALVGDH